MGKIEERNQQVRRVLNSLYERAIDPSVEINESVYKESLEKLFSTTTWGFREVLLVVIVAMHLNRAFKASTRFYECNPRAIYEGPIKDFLIEKELPHRKSGPLNVAKAAQGIDMTWAAQREPADVALELVELIKYLEEDASQIDMRITSVGISLIRRLIKSSNILEALAINIAPNSDPFFLYRLCYELITKTPDAGNTPQKIAGYLLKNYHICRQTGITVTGVDDRASVTSTTSKKPGDLNEETPEGVILKVYEITVKPFDLSRIRDSYDCVSIYNNDHHSSIHEIIVVCRQEDCPSIMNPTGLQGCLGSYIYQDVIYYYCNIYEWIAYILHGMTNEGRVAFYQNLNTYISDINTSESVKKLWKSLHEGK